MLRQSQYILILCICTILWACQSSQGSAPLALSNMSEQACTAVGKTTPRVPPAAVASKPNAIAPIQTACEQASAHWNGNTNTCYCADGKTFIAHPEPACVELQELEGSQGNDIKCWKTAEGHSRVCLSGQTDSNNHEGLPADVITPVMPSLPAQPTATVILSDAKVLASYFHGIGPYSDFALDQIHLPTEIALPHLGAIGDPVISTYFEPDPKRVFAILSNSRESLETAPIILPALATTDASVIRAVRTAIESYRTDLTRYEGSRTVRGCLDVCRESESTSISADGQQFGIDHGRVVAGGTTIRDSMLISDAAGAVRGQIQFTPIGDMSLLWIYRYDFEPSDQTFVRSEIAFGRNGDELFRIQSQWRRPRPDKFWYATQADAVVCEPFFPTTADEIHQYGLQGHIALGKNTSKSILGWIDNNSDDLSARFTGYSGSYFRPGIEASTGTIEHGGTVSQIVVENGASGIAPIGLRECLQDSEGWRDAVLKQNIKVVNLSTVTAYDRSSCADSTAGKTIISSPFLWVVGAGNGGESLDTVTSNACPQNLGPLPNLIVVSAGDRQGGWIIESSTQGEDYADIIASGKNPQGSSNDGATSYAAPRVTGLAAKLSKAYPALTPQTIRFAILASAKIEKSRDSTKNVFLNVRSGGWVDEVSAVKLAKSLQSNPPWTLRLQSASDVQSALQTLTAVFCEGLTNNKLSYEKTKCDTRVDERLARLIAKGVINAKSCH